MTVFTASMLSDMHEDSLDSGWDGDWEALLGVILLDLEHPRA
jgi:hypothetical protein